MCRAALQKLPVATSAWACAWKDRWFGSAALSEQPACLPACLLCSTTLAAGESGLEFLCLGGSLAFAFLAPEIEPGASCVPDKCSPTELSTISPESQC